MVTGNAALNTIHATGTNPAGRSSTVAATAFRNQIAYALAGGTTATTGSAVATGAETLALLSMVATPTPPRDPVSVTYLGY